MPKNNKTGKAVAIGLGAIAAAAAASYFLTGKRGTKNRAKIKRWASDIKHEVLAELLLLKDVNKARYEQLVNAVVKRYEAVKEATPAEMNELKKELKDHWSNIEKQVRTASSASASKRSSSRKAK